MIKCTAKLDGGRHLLLLGITDANIERLRADQPMVVDPGEAGLPWEGKITIVHGKDEAAIEAMLWEHGLITGETEIRKG